MKHQILSFVIFIFVFAQLGAMEGTATGTLIVSYHCYTMPERLERIRFWLQNDKQDRHLYPKGDACEEGSNGTCRTVVIEGLPVGEYVIHFVFPNTDNYFADIPEKKVQIKANTVIKVDQVFLPHQRKDVDFDV